MSKFIELTQGSPGVGAMTVNTDFIVKVEPSAHAGAGADIILRDGRVSYDAETGCQSYTVAYSVKEPYAAIKRHLL